VVPPIGQGLAIIVTLAGVAIVFLIGIGVYVYALHIAAQRTELARLDARIVAARGDVRRLGEDVEVRSRMHELERWRGPLGLQPETLGQRVTDPRQLASAAAARRVAQAQADALVRPVDTGPRLGYAPAARADMDTLIGDIVG
jgi:hypothetical protein